MFYKFGNLHLSISSWACGSYPHHRFGLYFIAGYIVTLCDVAYRPPAQEHSAPAPAPALARSAIPNQAKSGTAGFEKIKSGATLHYGTKISVER